ncbi:Sulfite exporter TauE/SafE [Methyloligella halotolerans]|uniref:Probable membrane transporter protein n=1 Tax=Methyloligella halotolerans TaxID=1177755 RepID=A0A1E2S064_9HYPH|nr:Sulfite exporter TauE/SafE [Methyloligella halotolerans]
MLSIALAVGCGALVGFALGLIGGGGSILATPLLLYVVGIEQTHIAIGTSALAVSVNAFGNFAAHARAGHVWWRCALVFAAIGTLGALLGSTFGKAMDGERLLFLFGIVMIVVGAFMLKPRKPSGAGPQELKKTDLKTCLITGAVALVAGGVSGFFGIGGGFLIVPGLILATGMPTINAVGSSLFAVGTFGLATALNYARSGLIDWPVTALFVAGAWPAAWRGPRQRNGCPVRRTCSPRYSPC